MLRVFLSMDKVQFFFKYFSNKIHKGKTCYSEEQVISMLEFLIDNIFVSFGGTLFQQVVGIPMGTNCAPLLADLLLYSYESEFLQKLVKDKKIHEARAFNFTHRYIDDVLSINNSRLIYPPELEVKETTDTASSASFLDLYLEFDDSGQLSTKIYDKRDDFNLKIKLLQGESNDGALNILYVIQLSDRVYNVTFPAYDLYSLS